MLLNQNNLTNFETQSKDAQEAARAVGQQIHILSASTDRELDAAFAAAAQMRAGALLVGADPSFYSRGDRIVALAAGTPSRQSTNNATLRLPAVPMSYGTSFGESYRQVGKYTGRILKGEKPADLPLFQVTKFEFVLNLKTAKVLGLDVPAGLSARADEVIE